MSTLLGRDLKVLNVGLSSFAEPIRAAGVTVAEIDWRPPAGGDVAAGRALARLINRPEIEAANEKAFAAYLAAQPVIEDVKPAHDVIPAFSERLILHAGPPIAWERMCGPMRGAVVGAIMLEGWAADPEAAEALAGSGRIAFAPCHHFGAAGPMAGIVSPSMPLWCLRETAGGGRTFATLNEGLGKVLRYGANSAEVLERLRWMASVLGPVLGAALRRLGAIEVKPLIAQALHMGDEVHNRNVAASSLLLRRLLPGLLDSGTPSQVLADVVRFINGNDHFFLNVSMAACKAMLGAAHGVPQSTLVTTMARNGVETGIRVSGTGDAWFTAPAPVVDGLYFPGYGIADAAADIGDSAITETAGLGAFAMAAAPAIVKFVGGTVADAEASTRRMRAITHGTNPAFTIPSLNFAGTPAGIDVRKVVDRGIVPSINTGIAHREAGIGQIGAGLSHAPLACFVKALGALAARDAAGEP